MGGGKPVDALDIACKAHKECLKCANEQFSVLSNQCLSELVTYTHKTLNSEKYCTNDANTCGRAICECDLAFAKAHAQVASAVQIQYSFWFGSFDWTDQDNCSTNNYVEPFTMMPIPADWQCCTNSDTTKSFFLYNANTQKCCTDGSLEEFGHFC